MRNLQIFIGQSVAFMTGHLFTFLVDLSHLFSDYANIYMRKSDRMEAWNSIKNNSGHFIKNKRHQETGKEYFTIVQMIVKEEGY